MARPRGSRPNRYQSRPIPRSANTGTPTLFVYDRHPGGIGFSEKVYEMMELYPQPVRSRPSVEYLPTPHKGD